MHIAVNGWFIGQQTTGSGQYLHHLLQRLPNQQPGVDISVLVPAAVYTPAWQEQWPRLALRPVNLPPLPANWQKLWWEQIAFPAAARRLQPDVVWVPYWAAPLWQPRPVVVTVHDLIPLLLPAYRGGFLQRQYTALVTASARRSAAVLTVSRASARDIVNRLHIPASRVHVVYHGPNTAAGPETGAPWARPASRRELEAVAAKYDLPDRYFLYLGGFDVRKNVEAVMSAYKRYLERGGDPQVRLTLAGQLPAGDTVFAPDPRRMAVRLGLQDRVHFCGWVGEEDKAAIYALATAFVFPSLYEGFGMMLLEAMAAGTPVITSDR